MPREKRGANWNCRDKASVGAEGGMIRSGTAQERHVATRSTNRRALSRCWPRRSLATSAASHWSLVEHLRASGSPSLRHERSAERHTRRRYLNPMRTRLLNPVGLTWNGRSHIQLIRRQLLLVRAPGVRRICLDPESLTPS
jgi:hypothetical protein